MLLSAAFVLGACSQSPTGPTTSSQPTATVPRTAPARANP